MLNMIDKHRDISLTSFTEVVITDVSQVTAAPAPLAFFGLFVRGLFVPLGGIFHTILFYLKIPFEESPIINKQCSSSLTHRFIYFFLLQCTIDKYN